MHALKKSSEEVDEQKQKELRLFVFIVVFLFPLLTVMLVGASGSSIWMYQLVMGPPGPMG